MNDTIFAWTAPGANYPSYVNLSLKDGCIVVTVRTHANRLGQCGETVSVEVPLDAWKEFLAKHDNWAKWTKP